MPYDEALDERVTDTVVEWGTERRKMFGGTCHLLNGNMLGGVYKEFLIVRLGQEAGEAALGEPHTRPFDITGRPMRGWVMVGPKGVEGAALERWLLKARDFVDTLPPK